MKIDKTFPLSFAVNLSIESSARPEVKKHLSETVYGTKGKLRYKHKNSAERIDLIANPHFISLRRGEELLGTAGIMYRRCSYKKKDIHAWYIRYLSIKKKDEGNKGNKKLPDEKSKRSKLLNGHIKSQINGWLNTDFPQSTTGSAVFYALVEEENIYSTELCSSFGFEKIRKVRTHVFSRLFPKKDSNVSRIKKDKITTFLLQLHQNYSLYSFWFNDNILLDENYFVYKENEMIVAGIKALPVHWELVDLPGFSGFLIQKILPDIPVLSRMLNPKSLKFIAFEALWCKEGHEEKAYKLIESVCAEFNSHIGMLWTDEGCPLMGKIKGKGSWGFLSKIQKNVPADVLVKFVNVPEGEKKNFYTSPVYISAFDVT